MIVTNNLRLVNTAGLWANSSQHSPPPEWRRPTYYFIYPALYPEGKKFPLGVAWGGGGLLLLLFLNNFCYSCIENLKGKARWGEKKAICCHVQSGNYSWNIRVQDTTHPLLVPTNPPGPGSSTGTRQGWKEEGMCVPPSTEANPTRISLILAVVTAILSCRLVQDQLGVSAFTPHQSIKV